MAAGAKAADETDAAFRSIIDNDPEIQAVIRSVWGNTTRDERPSNTPKHLEKANDRASKQIAQILQRKGIDLPDRTFINPRSGTIEGHRGWSGLSGLQKGAIIAAAAAATGGALGAAGAFGGAAGGGAAGGGGAAASGAGGAGFSSGLGVTSGLGGLSLGAGGGLPVTAGLGGLSGVGATGVAAGGGSTGMGLMSSLGGLLSKGSNISDILKAVGGAASGSAQSQQSDRESGVNYQLLRDKLGIDNSATNENALVNRSELDLKQRGYQDTYRKDAFQDALRGSLISNFQGIRRPKGVADISFLGPNAISAMHAPGAEMGRQGMERATKPATFEPLPTYKPYDLTSPEQMPGASTSEKIAGILGLGATAAGGMFPDKNQKRIEDLLAELEKR